LFEQWVAAKQPNPSTVNRWRSVFIELEKRFGGRSLSSVTHDDAQAWAEGLITKKRTPRTVTDVWCSAARTVLTWAVKTRKIASNPFEATTVTQPRKVRTRETDEFTPAEVKLVLTSALAFTDALRPFDAARRWVPWLCAYTGARAGEITQLRGKGRG
jgi:integrase